MCDGCDEARSDRHVPQATGRPSVLIIGDEWLATSAVADIVGELGCTVLCQAGYGDEGAIGAAIEACPAIVVISQMYLDGGIGVKTLRALRQATAAPALLISGDLKDFRPAEDSLGAVATLPPGAEVEDVRAAVAALLAHPSTVMAQRHGHA